jgi:hypothetical protein
MAVTWNLQWLDFQNTLPSIFHDNGNGVFMSSDNGRSWQDMNLNLALGITVFAIKVCPFSGSVYLGTSFGTFRLDAAVHTEVLPKIWTGMIA